MGLLEQAEKAAVDKQAAAEWDEVVSAVIDAACDLAAFETLSPCQRLAVWQLGTQRLVSELLSISTTIPRQKNARSMAKPSIS